MRMLIHLIELAVAVGTISLTLTRGSIFRSARLWIKEKSTFFGGLFSCPYCMSHWIGAITSLTFGLRLFSGPWLLDFIFSTMVLIGISTLFSGIVMHFLTFSPDEEDPYELIEQLTETINALKTENEELKAPPF